MRTKSISLPRPLRRSFTYAAKKAFPAETFAFCLGHKVAGGKLQIDYLLYPEIILDDDGLGFEIPEEAQQAARDYAKETGTKVICTLHSHPYPQVTEDPLCACPSETDWDYNSPHLYMGICQVHEISGKLRARFRFWPPLASLELLP